MKLHLPKALLTAVLAVCVAQTVQADWAPNDKYSDTTNGKIVFYTTANLTVVDKFNNETAKSCTNIWIAPESNNQEQVFTNVYIADGDTLSIVRNPWTSTIRDFKSVTIESLKIGDGTGAATLIVNTNQNLTLNAVEGSFSSVTAQGSIEFTDSSSIGTLGMKNGGVVNFTGGTHTVEKMDIHNSDDATTETLTISGATVKITGSDGDITGEAANTAAVTMGHWKNGTAKVIVGGNAKKASLFDVSGATIRMSWDSASALEIKENGTVNAKGIQFANNGNGDAILTLAGGRLNLGDGGVSANSHHNNGEKKREINLNSGTLGALADKVVIAAGTTNIGGAVTIDTAIVDAAGNQKGGTADFIFSNNVVVLSDIAALTVKGGGSVTINSLNALKTLQCDVHDATKLNVDSVSLSTIYGDLQLDAVSAKYTDNSEGASSVNGFRTGEVVLRLFDGYEWNGSIEGYTVSTQNGDTLVTTSVNGSTYYVNEGTHKISTNSVYINGKAEGYSVAKDANLVIDGASGSLTAAQLLTGTLGDGNIILGTNITLTSGAATQISGNIIVNSGFDLKLGTQFSSGSAQQGVTVNIAGGIVLNGGQLSFCGDTTTLKSVTTQGAGSKIYIRDMYGSAGNAAGTFTIENLTLNADTQYQSSWKSNVEFKNLSGSGVLQLLKRDGGDKQMITIHAGKNYTGQLDLDGGADMSVYLNIAEGATTRIKGNNDSTIAKLSFASGATLALDTEGGTINGVENSAYTYTLKAVEVADTATISIADSGAGWQAQVNIDSLTNEEGSSSGKLNLTSNTKTSQRAIVNLNGGTFNGEIALTGSATADSRKIALIINDDDVAKNAVITLNGNGSQVALAVGADNVVVKGIKNAENANGTMKIVSGAQGYSQGDSSGEDFASDSTTRTLEINTNGGSYSTSAVLGANLNLKKSGSGTQTFTGSMANFTGSITVNEGKLALSATGLSNNTGSFTATQNTGESELQFDVSSNSKIKDVSLKGGASLVIFNKNQDNGTRVTDIETLTIDGAGTVGTLRHDDCFQGIININSLSNTGEYAELTLKNGSTIDNATIFNLNGGTFVGTLNLEADSSKGSRIDANRKLHVYLNDTDVAAGAVINFQDPSTDTADNKAYNYITLGVGVKDVDGVEGCAKVAGLTGTTANAATIKATEGTKTLEIITAADADYSTNAKVENSINLVKSGAGKQTITGAVNANSVTVNGGELQLSGAENLGDVNIGAGSLSISNTGTTATTTLNTLQGSGSLSFTGNEAARTLAISSLQGYTGSLTVTKGTGATSLEVTTGGAATLTGLTLENGADMTLNGGNLTVGGNLKMSLASDITLDKDATLHLGSTVSVKGVSSESTNKSQIVRITDGGDTQVKDDTYSSLNTTFSIKNAHVTVSSETDINLSNKLDNSAITNNGTGTVNLVYGASDRTEVNALKGNINMMWMSSGNGRTDILTKLEVADNLTIAAQVANAAIADITKENLSTLEVTKTAIIGSNATVKANLTLTKGASITLNGYGETAATITGTLELGTRLELSGNVVKAIEEMQVDDKLLLLKAGAVVFGELDDAAYGEYADLAVAAEAMVAATPLLESIVDARTYFSSLNVGDYQLLFEQGALYIQKTASIPEPTTATLSLLALAALASRRRRK